MPLHIVTWAWGSKYSAGNYVEKLQAGLQRHLTEPFRFLVAKPSFEDEALTKISGCFCRLRMFDPQWQEENEIYPDDRVVCIDLDVVVTGELFPLFYRPEPFLILQGANSSNPGVYNGSVFMFRAGYRPDVWHDFSLEAAQKVPFYSFPDDQAWLESKIPNAPGWKVGSASGIFAFKKPQWPPGDGLPGGARLVVFPGWRDPGKFTHLKWVKDNWIV